MHWFIRIDLTRMECKDKRNCTLRRLQKSIDLTRMECKVQQTADLRLIVQV